MRGGVSNNIRIPEQESKHILHVDANNLYGYAISNFLPIRGF